MTQLVQRYRPRVLVIDDDQAVCDVVVRILQRADFEATSAAGGIAGVELAEATGPDLILLDLEMGSIDGRVTLRLLRAQAPSTVILAFTGLFILDEPLLHEGFDGVIRKPVFAFQLVEEITRALDGTPALCGHDIQPEELLTRASERLRTA